MPLSPTFATRSAARHLLPASNTHGVQVFIPVVPSERISPFTLGRGTVLWRIWPAVMLHTLFAAVVVETSERTQLNLGIPNVLLTVCGVVIGFVLSYRASSGYDRYWMGRSAWGDLMRNARTLARLIWFHIPARLGGAATDTVPEHEVRQVMREKRMAIKMIEGFAVATKHHLRGEMTIYYQDLYPLVVPLHQHPRREHGPPKQDEPKTRPSLIAAISTKIGSAISRVSSRSSTSKDLNPPGTPPPMTPYVLVQDACLSSSPGQTHDVLATSAQTPPPHVAIHMDAPAPAPSASTSTDALLPKAQNGKVAYGTFADAPDSPATVKLALQPVASESSVSTSETSSENGDEDGEDHENTPLFPSSLSAADRAKLPKIATELVAFSSFVEMLSPSQGKAPQLPPRPASPQPPAANGVALQLPAADDGASAVGVEPGDTYVSHMDRKHRPRIPGGGENLPLQILWTLSDWLATCERRGTVPGTSLGAMIGTLAAFEDSLTQLEKILMTPLPFVYSVHIRHVVWVYMFCMPFQLVDPFGIWTIPGVAVAAFFFLGLLAAGEEIEQPFGYDENDLNLDLFTNEMVHHELAELAHTAGINVYQRSLGNNGLIADICATRRHKPHPIAVVPPNGEASPAPTPTPLPQSYVAPLTTVPNVGIEVHVIPDHSQAHIPAPAHCPPPTAPH